MGCGAGGDGSGLAAARPACALHPSTCSPEARPAGQAGTAGLYIPGLLSRSGPYWDPGTGPWPPRLACVFFGSRSPGQDINVWMLSSVPPTHSRMPALTSLLSGAELWVHAVRGPQQLGCATCHFQRFQKLVSECFHLSP